MNGKLLSSILVAFAVSLGTAQAQTASGPAPGPRAPAMHRPPFSAAFPLRMAYRTIGLAESRGAGGRFLDAARTHYRSALSRFARSDQRGAASEALAAAALARAALDQQPEPTPRDLPSPPPPAAPRAGVGPGGRGQRFIMRVPGPGGPGGPVAGPVPFGAGPAGGPRPWGVFFRRFRGHGRGHGGGRFNPAALARFAKLENTPEANDLARNALDADIAGERARFAGNRAEARRQGRLAHDLAAAVRALALADHPMQFPRPRVLRRPMQQQRRGPGNPGGPMMRPAPQAMPPAQTPPT